jgi:hypothetical protein
VADALITAPIAVLLAQPADDLGDRVPLLAGRVGVGTKNLVDHGLERINDRRQRPPRVRLGFGLAENLADLAARVMEPLGQFTDAELVDAMGVTDAGIFVHLDHPPPPAAGTSVR